MEMNLNQFITNIIHEADNAVDEFLFNAYINLVNNNIDVFTSLLVIYVVITGVRGIYYGFAMSDIFTPMLKMSVVYALATTWPYFHDYIYSFLVQVPNEIIKAFGTPGADGAYGLNTVFVKGFEIVTRLFEAGGWSAIHYYILALIVLVVNLFVMAAGLGGILVAKFLLAIYLFLSPIFLMLFLFESYSMKKYFPTILHPKKFIFEKEQDPIYYSLQYPATHNFSPKSRTASSMLVEMRELSTIIDIFLKHLSEDDSFCSGTVYADISKHLTIRCLHNQEDKHKIIGSSNQILNSDHRFAKNYDYETLNEQRFAADGKFFRGCVSISKNSTT